MVQPDVHNADLDFGRPARGVYYGPEIDAFLQDVLAPLFVWNSRQLFRRRPNDHTRTSERVKGFQHIVLGLRDVTRIAQEASARYGRMVQIWKGKFAEAEEPVRMAGPFHIQVVAKVEG